MIRCVKLWTGKDGKSHFEEGVIDLGGGTEGNGLSGKFPAAWMAFQETDSDPKLGWHTDPARQLVVTLGGRLKFETADGFFELAAGDILFTEDIAGRGHDWTMLGNAPWRRLYAAVAGDIQVPFVPTKSPTTSN